MLTKYKNRLCKLDEINGDIASIRVLQTLGDDEYWESMEVPAVEIEIL